MVGHGLVFDRIYRINRIEGDEGQKERGRRGNHAESAKGRGNSDCWQGYANAPPVPLYNKRHMLRSFFVCFVFLVAKTLETWEDLLVHQRLHHPDA